MCVSVCVIPFIIFSHGKFTFPVNSQLRQKIRITYFVLSACPVHFVGTVTFCLDAQVFFFVFFS